jgi:cation diffusion facilitator family transporter
MKTAQKNIRIQSWVAAISVSLLFLKIVAYYLTHSVAILTDALEGIVNVVAGFMGLYSLYISARPRDANHPYGHGKVEFISAGIEGGMILLAGIAIFYKAIVALITPQSITSIDTGMILLAITGLLNFTIGRICLLHGERNNSLALTASGKHLQSDAYSTVAIIVGLLLFSITKLQWIDSVIAIGFSVFILYTGYSIVKSAIAGIMDETDEALLKKLVTLLNFNRKENWIDLHNTRIIKYGSVLHIDCHLTVPWYLNVHEAHNEIDIISELVRKEFGDAIELFVHSDGCLDFSCDVCVKENCTVRKHAFKKKIEWTIENVVRNQKHSLH